MSIKSLALVFGLALLAEGVPSNAATTTLYNGAGAPADQPWLTFTNLGATQFADPGRPVNLNSTASNNAYAGYSNYTINPAGPSVGALKNSAFPPLDRTLGYTLNFNVKINSESHNRPDRAGFSVTAISSDLQGIELGFWTDEVWAQNVGFTKGESSSFDTTTALVAYELTVLGDTYTLAANGVPLASLTNQSLRNYSSFGSPYNTPNFIFFGDNTTSAGANITLGAIATSDTIPVPFEFSPLLGVLALGAWGVIYQLKSQKK